MGEKPIPKARDATIAPCPLCDAALEIGTTKKQKPYMICEPCGLQLFVRYQKGIERLEELSGREVSLMDGFVVCNSCDVAVRKSLHSIQEPLFRKAGLYCPSCEELLLKVYVFSENGTFRLPG